MNHRIRILIMVLGSLVATQALAENWVSLGKDAEGSATYIERHSHTDSDGDRRAWSRIVYAKPRLSSHNKMYDEIRAMSVYRCQNRTLLVGDQKLYLSGQQADEYLGWGQWSTPAPGTVGGDEMDYVCGD